MSMYFIAEADDMELSDVAQAIADAGFVVGATRVRQALDEIERLRAALQRVIDTPPAVGQDGSLFIEHCDSGGNPLGIEHIDSLAVIHEMVGIAVRALGR